MLRDIKSAPAGFSAGAVVLCWATRISISHGPISLLSNLDPVYTISRLRLAAYRLAYPSSYSVYHEKTVIMTKINKAQKYFYYNEINGSFKSIYIIKQRKCYKV